MNLFLHGIEDFQIANDDVLTRPAFLKNDRLQTFDIVLANPPYSIKSWNRTAFDSDKYGRNFLGTPPQGRADYAFFQHILKSLRPNTGRCAILFPHGILFRGEEADMRKKLIENDLVECVIGIGKNLFYNSPMDACVVICRSNKPAERRGKVLFINAKDEVTRKNSNSYLEDSHIEKIANVYYRFESINGFSAIAETDRILSNDGKLSIALYVEAAEGNNRPETSLEDAIAKWVNESAKMHETYNKLSAMLLEESR